MELTNVTFSIKDVYTGKPSLSKISEARKARDVHFELFSRTQGHHILKNDRFFKILKYLSTENNSSQNMYFSNMFLLRGSEVKSLMEEIRFLLEQRKRVQVMLLFKLDNSTPWKATQEKPCIMQLPTWVEHCPRIYVRTLYDLPQQFGMFMQPALHLNCLAYLSLKLGGNAAWRVSHLAQVFAGPNENFIQAKIVNVNFSETESNVALKIIGKCNQVKINKIYTEIVGKASIGHGYSLYFREPLHAKLETFLVVTGFRERLKSLNREYGFLVSQSSEDDHLPFNSRKFMVRAK